MKSAVRQIVFGLVVFAGVILLYRAFNAPSLPEQREINVPQFLELVTAKPATQVRKAVIDESHIAGELTTGEKFTINLSNPSDQASIAKVMSENNVDFSFTSSSSNQWLILLFTYAPWVTLAALALTLIFWTFVLSWFSTSRSAASRQ
jgi:ATP-dependent Zn protease